MCLGKDMVYGKIPTFLQKARLYPLLFVKNRGGGIEDISFSLRSKAIPSVPC